MLHTVLDKEYARVLDDDMQVLKQRKNQTLLFDGWEDLIKRSLYGTLAAKVNEISIIVGLENISGKRGDADTLLATVQGALDGMNAGDMKAFIAATTDNPTVMRAFRRKLSDKFSWLLVR